MVKTPKISSSDVGSYVVDNEGNLFRIITFTSKPTFTVEKLNTKERSSFIVGANDTENLSKLVKEEKK